MSRMKTLYLEIEEQKKEGPADLDLYPLALLTYFSYVIDMGNMEAEFVAGLLNVSLETLQDKLKDLGLPFEKCERAGWH